MQDSVLALFLDLEMNADGAEQVFFEIAVVVPKRNHEHENEIYDCVEVLVDEFMKMGLKVERVHGMTEEFIKVSFLSNFSILPCKILHLPLMIFVYIIINILFLCFYPYAVCCHFLR